MWRSTGRPDRGPGQGRRVAFPRHIVEEVRARTDIAEVVGRVVTLKRSGRNLTGLCPFHNERTPSFNVIPEKGIYHCFGCGAGGDVIRFVQQAQGVDFMTAVKDLAQAAGITIQDRPMTREERQKVEAKADLYDAVEVAARFMEETLLLKPEGEPGRDYLQTRGLSSETARRYRIGYAPEGWDRLATHLQRQRIPMELAARAGLVKRSERTGGWYDTFRGRICFPILDERGRPVAFGGRILPALEQQTEGPAPKYLNSPESEIYEKSKTLYGLWYARMAIQRKERVLLVEGYFDAVALWQAGVEEVVATCGTALTAAHAERLRRLTKRAIALFDADEAGMRAAVKSMDLFLDAGLEARRLQLTGAKDPDEYILRYGAEAFEEQLNHTEPLVEVVVRRTLEQEGAGPEGQARAVEALLPLLRKLPELVRIEMSNRVAGWVGMPVPQMLEKIGQSVSPVAAAPAPTRWMPNKDLTHLLWLIIHHPHLTGAAVMQADPAWITDQQDVLEAIAALCAGRALPDVLAEIRNEEVQRIMLKITSQPELYLESQVSAAANQILIRMELPHVEAKITAVNAEISGCANRGDTSSYSDLARAISSLYARRVALRAQLRRA